MRKVLYLVLAVWGGAQLLAEDVGGHYTAGFNPARTYLNSDMGNFKPPLSLSRTVNLSGVNDADTLIAFQDELTGVGYFLVGENGTDVRYHLFDRDSGALLWTRTFPGAPGPAQLGRLLYTPAVSNDIAILGGPATSTVKAVRISTGTELWEDKSVGGTNGRHPALSHDVTVYHGAKKIVAATASTGVPIWMKAATTAEVPVTVHGQQVYYVTKDGTLHAVDLGTGTELWMVPFAGSDGSNIIATEKYVFINGPGAGSLAALDAHTGAILWVNFLTTFAFNPGIALAYDTLFAFLVSPEGLPMVQAYNPDTGELLWEVTEPAPGAGMAAAGGGSGSPALLADSEAAEHAVVVNNVVYYYDPVNQRIRARDAFTGTLLWSIFKPGVQFLSAADGCLLVLLDKKIEVYKAVDQAFFAIIANGQGQSTLLVLTNVSPDTAAAGSAEFINKDGTPLALPVAGVGTVNKVAFVIPPGSSLRLQTTGAGSLSRGWVRVTADQPIRGSSIFQFTEAGDVRFEAGIGDAAPIGSANVFILRSGRFNTGVAAGNVADETAHVEFTLLDSTGAEVDSLEVEIGVGECIAQFIDELFPAVGDGFEGTLVILSDMPLTVTALRTKDGFQMSSYPVAQAVK